MLSRSQITIIKQRLLKTIFPVQWLAKAVLSTDYTGFSDQIAIVFHRPVLFDICQIYCLAVGIPHS